MRLLTRLSTFSTICKWVTIVVLPVLMLLALAPAHLAQAALSIHPHSVLALGIGATVGPLVATLTDWAKRLDPDGRVSKVAELLNQSNAILDDMQFVEGNLPTGHRVTVRTGLPTPVWRLLNTGVPSSKSTTAQFDEQVGMLEARGQVDIDLAELNGNTSDFRLSEAQAFIEGMNEEFSRVLFYGNAKANPEQFTGLSARYSSKSAKNGQNIIDAGGVQTDNCSVWLVCWGANTISGIFPKGSKAGLVHEDLGQGDAFDASNNRYRAWLDRWQWKGGIALRDWRYVVRVANIDVSNLVAESSNADLIKVLSRALDRVPNLGMGTPVFYANRTVKSWLRVQGLNKSNAAIAVQPGLTQFGKPGMGEMTFMGVPVRTVDQLTLAEAQVT